MCSALDRMKQGFAAFPDTVGDQPTDHIRQITLHPDARASDVLPHVVGHEPLIVESVFLRIDALQHAAGGQCDIPGPVVDRPVIDGEPLREDDVVGELVARAAATILRRAPRTNGEGVRVIDDGVPVDVGHGIESMRPFSRFGTTSSSRLSSRLDGIDRAVALEVDDRVPDAVKLKVANDLVHAVLLLRRHENHGDLVRVNVPGIRVGVDSFRFTSQRDEYRRRQ